MKITEDTKEGQIWADYPNVTYKIVDKIPTLTLSNANISITTSEGEEGQPYEGIYFALSAYSYPDARLILEGNNTLQCNMYGTPKKTCAIMSNSHLHITGSTTNDTLTVIINNMGQGSFEGDALHAFSIENVNSVKDCTLNFVMKETAQTGIQNEYRCLECGEKFTCDNVRINCSFANDAKDEYSLRVIRILTSFSSISNSELHFEPTECTVDLSYFFGFGEDTITFDIYNTKIDAEMKKGKIFEKTNLAGDKFFYITFHGYKSLAFYKDASDPKVVTTGQEYSLSGNDYDATKFISESKEVTAADNSTAVIATVFASALIAILAILVVLFRRTE